jgi:hypothetical protein
MFGKYLAPSGIWNKSLRSRRVIPFRLLCGTRVPYKILTAPSISLSFSPKLLHLTGQKSCVPYSLQASLSRPTQPAIPPASKTHHALLYSTAGCPDLQPEPPSTMAEYHTTQPTSLVQTSRGQTLSVSPEERALSSTTAAPKQSR